MSPWQFARQLQQLLSVKTWGEGSDEVVFASVHVTEAPSDSALAALRTPFALIAARESVDDPQAPGLGRETFEIAVVVHVAGDDLGENAFLGAARASGSGSSKGRGLLEVEEKLSEVAKFLDQTSGVRLRMKRKSSSAGAFQVEAGGYVAARSYFVEVDVTDARSYPAPYRLAGTNQGSGAIALTWAVPPARFDFVASRADGVALGAKLVLRRAAGSTAPATASSGTGVTLASAFAASVTDTPGAGTFSWALFAGYDETGSGTVERWSTAATLTKAVT